MQTSLTPEATGKRGIDKGDYILVYDPEHIMSFCITWVADEMKSKDFQDWLEIQKREWRLKIPKHFVLIDQFMNNHKPLVSKTFKYADPAHLSIATQSSND